MDVLAQRLLSIQESQRQGGKTDLAVLRELLPSDSSTAGPAGMVHLKG